MLRLAELFAALAVALVVVFWRVWVALPRRLKSQDGGGASGKRAQEAGSARTSSADSPRARICGRLVLSVAESTKTSGA